MTMAVDQGPKHYFPNLANSEKVSHVMVVAQQESRDKMFDEFFDRGPNPRPAAEKAGAECMDLGRISSMKLPAGWESGATTQQGPGYTKEFYAASTKNVDNVAQAQVNVSYRGHRLSDQASERFRNLIDMTPENGKQKLDAASLQKSPMSEVLGDKGDSKNFVIFSASLERTGGEPSLVIEGQYAGHKVNTRTAYIDAENHNRSNQAAPVQEISYVAATSEFNRYYDQVKKSLDGIVWKR